MELKFGIRTIGSGKNRRVLFTNPFTGEETSYTVKEFQARFMNFINELYEKKVPINLAEIKVSPAGYDITKEHFKHLPLVKISKLPGKPAAKRKSPAKKKAVKRKAKDIKAN
ncbi:MAG: hypothetical protein AB7G44_16120 [Bacteroidia bacterium]